MPCGSDGRLRKGRCNEAPFQLPLSYSGRVSRRVPVPALVEPRALVSSRLVLQRIGPHRRLSHPGLGARMISRYRQLHRHAPEEGLIGDCWRTCIACILGLKPQAVPHFVEQAFDQGRKEGRHIELANAWLKSRDLMLWAIALRADSPKEALQFPPNVPYILGGRGSKDTGIDHCVVGFGAFETLWDPSPWSTEPLQPLIDEASGVPYYWVELLVPINLARGAENS